MLKKTLKAVSKSGIEKTVKTKVEYKYGVFETSTNNKNGERKTYFEGFSKTYSAAESKSSSSRAVNKSCEKWHIDQAYTNIEKEIVELVIVK